MHECSLCHGIIEVVAASLEDLGPPRPRVSRVTVRVGRLTGAVPDTLRHYFALLTPGTSLAGATLAVEEVPILGRCADCAARFSIDTLCFTCPACGSGFVELTSGRELEVVSLDTVDEEVTCAR